MNTKNKTTAIIAGVCVCIVFLFWVFIYSPANRRMRVLRLELASVKNDISEIESRAGRTGQDIVKMADSLQKDLKEAVLKLPDQEEGALRLLSEEANRQGLEIISMSPAAKRPYLDNNIPVLLEGKQCFELPVAIDMKGLYKSVGEYLRVLREEFPALVKVEALNMQKDESIAPRLRVNLELTLHILCSN